MKKYLLMHDYGSDGWKIIAEGNTILEVVEARENNLSYGESIIMEVQDTIQAYTTANYERGKRERTAL